MHLRKVKIVNVRGFRDVDLDLTRHDGNGCAGWTVVAGRNGSGKTTLLQAIAMGLTSGDSVFTIDEAAHGWVGSESEASATFNVLRASDDTSEIHKNLYPGNLTEEERAYIERLITLDDAVELEFGWHWLPKVAAATARPATMRWRGEDLEDVFIEQLRSDRRVGWFAVGYGAFRRRFGHASELAERIQGSRKQAAFATLFREDQALVECTQWLKDTHFRALDKNDASLRELRDNTLRLLNDGLLPDGVSLTRVDSDGLWAHQHNQEKLFDRLSSGFRVVASLVLDVIAQMHRAFGTLRVEERDGHLAVPHSGVVLIDEAEEHLHPSWQRALGFWFKRHFPNVQFIVSTHSPFVCQAADLIVRLHPDGDDAWTASRADEKTHAAVVNGTLDDAVLSDLFGLEEIYTERTERLRDEVAALEVKVIRGSASPEEIAAYAKLAAQLPANSPSHMEQMLRRLSIER